MNRGSEWKKWDLHLHTPDTRLANSFSEGWGAYLDALAAADLALIGVTNYFCFVPEEVEKVRRGLKQRGSSTVVLPNVEFRITQPNKDGEQINVHVLFSEALSTERVNSGLSKIPLAVGDQSRRKFCCDEDLSAGSIGYADAVVEFSELLKGLKDSFDRQEYLVALCPSGYGSFRPARGEGRGNSLARNFDQYSDLLFGREDDRDFFLGIERYDGAIAKPVFLCSDAHKIDEIGSKFTYVRAVPGIEGLRQSLYEPDIRVSLNDEPVRQEAIKPAFTFLQVDGPIFSAGQTSFKRQELKLNSGLVALIGGRGTGKSVLLDCLFRSTQSREARNISALADFSDAGFVAKYQKQGASDNELTIQGAAPSGISYLHVRQGDVRKIAQDPDLLSEEIKKLLGLHGDQSQHANSSEIRSILAEIDGIASWMQETNEVGEFINSREYNELIVGDNQVRIDAVSSDENKQLISDYQIAVSRREAAAALNANVQTVLERFAGFSSEVASLLDTESIRELGISWRPLHFKAQLDELNRLGGELDARQAAAAEEIANLRDALRAKGIEQDPEGLLDKVGVFRAAIAVATAKLSEGDVRRNRLDELISRRGKLARRFIESLENEALRINSSFQELRNGKRSWSEDQADLVRSLLADVSIRGELEFDTVRFYEWVSKSLDLRKFRGGPAAYVEKLAPKFGVKNIDDLKKLLVNEPIIDSGGPSPVCISAFLADDELFIDGGARKLAECLFVPSSLHKFIRVRALIEYKGKEPGRLSVGQRGTFYLCMKLATDPFGSPFVFDQPEDDLDNEFIVRELVPLFREIKRYRQVIIATHNANLVVNADADQVIVASNSGEVLEYRSGAIETAEVRESICDILEGGRDAFRRREMKYGMD